MADGSRGGDHARTARGGVGHVGVGRVVVVASLLIAALLVAAFGVLGLPASPAWASDQGLRAVTRYDATYELAADGSALVTLDFDFDFADTPGHGPFLTLPIKQAIEGDEENVRAYPVSGVTASSPTGAPANVYLTETPYWLEIRIGDENIGDVSGVQRYVVRYTVRGVVNPGAGAGGEDEFYWNVVGSDWVIPLSDLTVTVTGPGQVLDAVCYAGPAGGAEPCTSASFSGSTAAFTHGRLDRYEPLTVAAAYPGGTFAGAAPIIVETPRAPNPFAVTPWTVGAFGLVLAAGSAFVVRRSGQRGRDEQYLGLTPGLSPVLGQDAPVGPADRRAPIAVQFTPPAGVRAGQMGTLVDEVADPKDVTATIVDLAVRGYLRIEEVEAPNARGRGGDWNLRFLGGPAEGLTAYERELMDSLFATSLVVTLSGIKTTFASAMSRVQAKLYVEVTRLGWFRADPSKVRARWVIAGVGVIVLGVGLTLLLSAFTEWALAPIAVGIVGVIVIVAARRAPARTAAGTAVLAQTLGFKRYLETAEAHQIRFEEGEDVFSRYLPFAIVFGVAERWAGIFEQLAREGRAIAEPGWYMGRSYAPGYFWLSASHFGNTMESFSSIATTAISAPTPGSSGSSGFGGGGFSGGGGGGGGGGGW